MERTRRTLQRTWHRQRRLPYPAQPNFQNINPIGWLQSFFRSKLKCLHQQFAFSIAHIFHLLELFQSPKHILISEFYALYHVWLDQLSLFQQPDVHALPYVAASFLLLQLSVYKIIKIILQFINTNFRNTKIRHIIVIIG